MTDGSRLGHFMELIHEINWTAILHVSFAVGIGVFWSVTSSQAQLHPIWMQVQHDRSFHLAGVAQAAGAGRACLRNAFGRERPIGGEHELRLRKVTLQLAKGGPQWHIVAAVTIEEENLSRAELNYRMAQLNDDLNIRHLPHAECARKKEVMGRVPRPERRQTQDLPGTLLFEAARDSGDDVRVRREGQMMAVLFE